MIAITLSFDKHAPFVQLMVERYAELWPNHPFIFRVPYNDEPRKTLVIRDDVELVQSPVGIRETMSTLLDGIDPNQWVYWAIDDRYPVALYKPRILQSITRFVQENVALTGIDEIKLTNHSVHGNLCEELRLFTYGTSFHQQRRGWAYGFWMHHFIRAGLLWRHFDEGLRDGYGIEEVTAKLRRQVGVETVLMPETSIIQFAEPCRRGYITENALADMRALGIDPPAGMDARLPVIFDAQGGGG